MSTTVGELKALLADLPDDWQVVMSKDAEGNGFSPFEEPSYGWYEPESTWSGDFDTEATIVNAVCLWPVN